MQAKNYIMLVDSMNSKEIKVHKYCPAKYELIDTITYDKNTLSNN